MSLSVRLHEGVLRYICKAGVKIRIVPRIDTVRKAHRKILSSTWATNFQSCTTWWNKERHRNTKVHRCESVLAPNIFFKVKHPSLGTCKWLCATSVTVNRWCNTHPTQFVPHLVSRLAKAHLSYKVLLFDMTADVANGICGFLQHCQPGLVFILLPSMGASLLTATVPRNAPPTRTSTGLQLWASHLNVWEVVSADNDTKSVILFLLFCMCSC